MLSRALIVCLVASLTTAIAPAAAQVADTRESIVSRAQVWRATSVSTVDLKRGPAEPGAFGPGETVHCTYVDQKLDGHSQKFACRLPAGDVVKVKFGPENGEVFAEVAATRLLWALGFGADRMYPVRVICRGCPQEIGTPPSPSQASAGQADRLVDPAVIERQMPGRELERSGDWSWPELDLIDEGAGGAPREQRDAFKLLAVMLQHTDSKPEQQKLICLEPDASAPATDAECARPFMFITDPGLTFGRANLANANEIGSVNLREWSRTPVWKTAIGCVGNLPRSLSGTLKDPPISDEGRRFLAKLLAQLSDAQLRQLFEVARVVERDRGTTIDDWVRVFKAKRDEIAKRRCLDSWSSTAPIGFSVTPNLWLQSHATPQLTLAMNLVSLLGYTSVALTLAVLLAFFWNLRAGAALLALLALNGVVTNVAKFLVDFPRPDAVDRRVEAIAMLAPDNITAALGADRPTAEQRLIASVAQKTAPLIAGATRPTPLEESAPAADDNAYGFPSGHVSIAAVFCLGLIFFFGWRRAWIALAIWVPLMAISRLYLGRHFVGDVFGGLAVAIIVTVIGVEALNLGRLARGTQPQRVKHVGRRFALTAAALALICLIAGVPRPHDAGPLLGLAVGILLISRDDETRADPSWRLRLARAIAGFAALAVAAWLVSMVFANVPWEGRAVELLAGAIPAAVLFPGALLADRLMAIRES